MIEFLKMHGLGNDFVVLDGRAVLPDLSPDLIRQISHRNFGVGCDQLIVMEHSSQADVFMRIYNPDASEAGACGNATRCVASLIMKETGREAVMIETVSGLLPCTKTGELVTVNMGQPKMEWQDIPLSVEADTANVQLGAEGVSNPVCVSMGNPHAVFFVEEAEAVAIDRLGPKFERDPIFPKRSNIEFVEVLNREHVRARVWERGAGVTLACGSGACAVAVAGVRRGLTGRKVTVTMDGGDLQLEWRESDNCVYMTGPVALVYKGSLAAS
jgi:diaminopimelate epimerase